MPRLKDCTFVAFDLETTGLSAVQNRIVEVSACRFSLKSDKIAVFSSLVAPGQPIPPEVVQIHGITEEMVLDAPHFSEIAPSFLEFIQGAVLLAHNIAFDLTFLTCALREMAVLPPENLALDTCHLARGLIHEAPNYKLGTLREVLALEVEGPAHRSEPDARACVELFKHCVQRLPEREDTSLEWLFDRYPRARSGVRLPERDSAVTQALSKAIQSHSEIQIEYCNARNEKTYRHITPIFLGGKGRFAYLEAFCHLRQANRQFRLDRIENYQAV